MRISDWSSDVCSSDLREAALDRFHHRALQPEGADAVGDEARRVVAMNDALAKDAVAENGYLRDRLRPRLLAGDQLQQRHVARRVEEVGDGEVAGEALRPALGQPREGRSGV